MAWEEIAANNLVTMRTKPLISLRTDRVSFNQKFMQTAGLMKYDFVNIYVDPEILCMAFAFHNDASRYAARKMYRAGSYSNPSKGPVVRPMFLKIGTVYREYPWIRAAVFTRGVTFCNFEASWDSSIAAWVIAIEPRLGEPQSLDFCLSELNHQQIGVYAIHDKNNEVIYYGEGMIKERLNAHTRRGWDIDKVSYTVVPQGKEAAQALENKLLTAFEMKHQGQRPLHNLNSGRTPK